MRANLSAFQALVERCPEPIFVHRRGTLLYVNPALAAVSGYPSEELIGRFISHRRGEYFLATKCGCTVVPAGDHDETPHVWTRENLLRNIDYVPLDTSMQFDKALLEYLVSRQGRG